MTELKKISLDETTESFLDSLTATKEAKIIPIRKNANEDITGALERKGKYYTGESTEEISPKSPIKRADVIYNASLFKKLDEYYSDTINEAFLRIIDSTDTDLTFAERSNSFDEWQELLKRVIEKSEHISINHRKIIGVTIASTLSKDITEFSKESLNLYREITNILRQQRVNEQDSNRVIESLLKLKQDITLPLETENISESSEKNLKDMMKKLVIKSRDKK